MKKLKIILNSKIFYVILIIITIVNFLINIFLLEKESKYNINEKSFTCIIDNYKVDGDKLKLDLDCREPLIGYYYFETEEEKIEFDKTYNIGDILEIKATLSKLEDNSNFNMFNYQRYGLVRDIYYNLNISSYKRINKSTNFIYTLKNYLNEKINKLDNYDYINALVLGNKDYIDSNVEGAYQNIGVMHLFSVSGTHVSIITLIIFTLLKKNDIKYIVTLVILIIYYLLVDSISLLRTIIFFIITILNKIFKLDLTINKKIILLICLMIFINPYYVYDTGFLFSMTISIALLLLNKRINNKKNYFYKTLYISFVAFIVSFPITIYNFFEVNLLSIFYNTVLVPLISIIVFPLALLTIFFPFFDSFLSVCVGFTESIALFFSSINSSVILAKPSLLIIIIYYIFIALSFINNRIYLVLLIMFMIHININGIVNKTYILAYDVGQGDSILIHNNNRTILIDTGGKINFTKEKWREKEKYSVTKKVTVPVLKSFGIAKIDYLILTHGDYDHMGEAIDLVENFKVEKVIFNCGEFNELEQDLVKVLDKKKISYYSCIKELNIDDNKLYFLNNKDYGNENDNSSVIYTKLNNYKFLFMADAGVEVEEDLIKKYNLQNIDVLKVGHHGSRTSSSKEFIEAITPKYSIISVGKNNRYGHPNDNVLDNLKDSKIYRTDKNGSIVFKIKNDKLKIETCAP